MESLLFGSEEEAELQHHVIEERLIKEKLTEFIQTVEYFSSMTKTDVAKMISELKMIEKKDKWDQNDIIKTESLMEKAGNKVETII